MPSLADEIKQKAIEIGFDKVGIVRAEQLQPEGELFRAWMGRNYQGNMAWLDREPEKRLDPRILFPGARSIVVCLLNYYTEHEHDDHPTRGKISRYAWGDDYHDVLREKLSALAEWIRGGNPESNGKVCVDTAPFMDKAWAVRAGLGWLGKSSNLVTQELGSWVFIGSIILDIELGYDDAIVDDHCGTCTACLDACPTRAIVEPYVVDSKKCISYTTIELRDETLGPDIADKLDGWIYGCDVCQDVCPWNRFEKPTAESRFQPRQGETSLDLEAVASMEHASYVERFRRSAMKRTKLSGLRRNASALRSAYSGDRNRE
jgi:epoxyqueuosine reductase